MHGFLVHCVLYDEAVEPPCRHECLAVFAVRRPVHGGEVLKKLTYRRYS